jgi:quinol monooxygenase YgiN
MAELVLVATFDARPGGARLLAERLTEMVAVTRREPGCVRYDLHVDREDGNRFVFVETWASQESWERHMGTPHVRALLSQLPELTLDGVRIQKLAPV